MLYPHLFKNKYPTLRGRDWVRRLPDEDLQVFIDLGMRAWDYGRVGGRARAATATRDWQGRFTETFEYELDYGDLYE